MNLSPTIVPKSDQLNADDLISGPITIKITSVRAGSAEQPVSIGYEGDAGRPYKPSKSMRRVLVMVWGQQASEYIGRRLTLYRDPKVRFGPDEVGGIKISHVSDIAEPMSFPLTESRGRRKPYTVLPLVDEAPNVALGDLPEAWESWSTEERGLYMASQGLAKLQAWWSTLTKVEKKANESRLRNEWKPQAEAKA